MQKILLFWVAIAVFGCSGGGDNPVEADGAHRLHVLSGDEQVGLQTKALPDPVVVRVTDDAGRAVPALSLSVRISEGDGEILNTALATDSEGHLAIQWQMGTALNHALTVAVPGEDSRPVTASAQASYLYQPPESIGDGWATGTLDSADASTALLLGAVDDIRAGVYPEIHSMLVVKDSELVLETYFPGHNSQGTFIAFDRTTQHEVQSASKSFRSAMIGIAIDEGFITNVDETLFSLLPEYAALSNEVKDQITLAHVLTMTSGLDWDETGAASGGTDNTLSEMYSLPATRWPRYVLARPLAFTPGTRFVYNTGASLLLTQIVVNASEMSMYNFVREYYSKRVESSFGYPLQPTVLPRDMARLGQVFLNEGRWKDQQVVSPEWVRQSCQNHIQVSSAERYGYQWWQRTFRVGQDAFESCYAAGNGGQFIFIIDDLNLVVVFTGGNFGSPTMNQVYGIIERHIIPAMR